MKKKLKVGDVVQWKSGGPLMTVTETEADGVAKGLVMVVWFTPDHQYRQSALSERGMRRADEQEGG